MLVPMMASRAVIKLTYKVNAAALTILNPEEERPALIALGVSTGEPMA